MTKHRTSIIGLIFAFWALAVAPCAVAQRGQLQPTFWKQRLFFIPYQVAQQGKKLNPIAKVQLLSSRTGANDWRVLEEAEPNVRGFSYHAPEDGDYWFALRHLDRRGRAWPNGDIAPQMRIVVDTLDPELTLEGTAELTGQIVIRYEARDANLSAASLLVEVRPRGGQWTPLQLGKADIDQPNRLVGRVRWQPPAGEAAVEVRASVTDRAGRRADAKSDVPLAESTTQPQGPALGSPHAASDNTPLLNVLQPSDLAASIAKSFGASAKLPSQDWPMNNELPILPVAGDSTPPTNNPYTAARTGASGQTPAKLVADGRSGYGPTAGMRTLQVTPLGPEDAAPPLASAAPSPSSPSFEAADNWMPAADSSIGAGRVVNSRTFDLDYELQSVGPWGVSKIELWGTQDGGQTWQSHGVDSDNRSPFRVTVPNSGTFGFRILVDGANSAGATPPQAGDLPELTVTIDLQPPTAELLNVELGKGNLADHLLLRWRASDTNLEPRPIALFYSSYPNGPWSTIASGLENTGNYTWRIERHVPGRFYLRLEARDMAGNLATFQNPTPIELARPQPTGRLRSVRPVE